MDLHRFHPVFFATPHGTYVIPQYAGNVGIPGSSSIQTGVHTGTWASVIRFASDVRTRQGGRSPQTA
jgi:hypothetical protein